MQGWHASLDLTFTEGEGKTIVNKKHKGPLQVQRPFYPEPDGTGHVYLLHPPGGVVGGDGLLLNAYLHNNTAGLITTPGATKIYRSNGMRSTVMQNLWLSDKSTLEWLPQETIVFSGAEIELVTEVHLETQTCFIGWEIICLGRPASGEQFTTGECRQRFELWYKDHPLWIDRSTFTGGSEMLNAPWGLNGRTVVGTMVCTIESAQSVHKLRELFSEFLPNKEIVEQQNPEESQNTETLGVNKKYVLAITQCDSVIVCRYLGDSAEQARMLLASAWNMLRFETQFKPAVYPRIWNT